MTQEQNTDYSGRPALRALDELPGEAPIETYFERLKAAIAEYYLSDPGNPYRQSGRGKGAARWEETRKFISDAVDRSGSFLDVGCANGLLLESMQRWLAPRGLSIEPHGIDFVPELIELARRRLPQAPATNFHVANAWDWTPPYRYDFVRTNLEYLPDRYWDAWIERHFHFVAPGGRLIICLYASSDAPRRPEHVLESMGRPVGGAAEVSGAYLAWTDT